MFGWLRLDLHIGDANPFHEDTHLRAELFAKTAVHHELRALFSSIEIQREVFVEVRRHGHEAAFHTGNRFCLAPVISWMRKS